VSDVERLAAENGARAILNPYAAAYPGNGFSEHAWVWPHAPRVLLMTVQSRDCAVAILDGKLKSVQSDLYHLVPFGPAAVNISDDGKRTYVWRDTTNERFTAVIIRHARERLGDEVFASVARLKMSTN
jgi:hypothetical protein